jgi:hypothetical protein
VRLLAKSYDDFADAAVGVNDPPVLQAAFWLKHPFTEYEEYWRKIEGSLGDVGPMIAPVPSSVDAIRSMARSLKLYASRIPPDALF